MCARSRPFRSPDGFTYRLAPDESPSEGIVAAVAAVSGTEPLSLAPLYSAVDPDALDGLFERPATDDVTVTFDYCDHEVAVRHGIVEVRPIDDDGRQSV